MGPTRSRRFRVQYNRADASAWEYTVNKKAAPRRTESRANIIQTVQTPLGFFTLVVLAVEALLGTTAGLTGGPQRSIIIAAMILLIFTLVVIVALLAYHRPEALHGIREEISRKQRHDETPIPEVLIVQRPKIFCAASTDFEKLGFDRDLAVIDESFRRRPNPTRGLTSALLRKALTENEYQIIHLTTQVDPQNGALVFSAHDQMAAEGFAKLIEVSKASLVVLAACDSVVLAAKVSRVTNMIAATSSVMVDDFVHWEDCFYRLLSRGQPLSRSFDIARATTVAPMVLLMKQDISFAA
jgi:hypothetical protein